MIALYIAVPFIRVNGHPVLLLDIANRRFSMFGHLFFAHEVPNLVFVATSFLFGIALVTTLFGRAWCGWSCPQTVFIERIFRAIEFRVIGDHLAQKRLHQAPLSTEKLVKRSIKWVLFILVSLLLAHFFLAYFVGVGPAFRAILEGPWKHPGAFFWVMLMAGIVLFDFAWFREQFCLVACPYGRFQSVMMDSGSLFLAYDEKRKDCIECGKCVAVCPTGIDVRHGLQFECIACTACADACDSVMKKIGKPDHLIGYGSLLSLAGKKVRMFRGRSLIYGVLFSISVFALSVRLAGRQDLQQEITRAVDTPYQMVKDPDGREAVINHFKIRFYNLGWEEARVKFGIPPEEAAQGVQLIRSGEVGGDLKVRSGERAEAQFFLKVPKDRFRDGHGKGILEGFWNDGARRLLSEVTLVGP
jgi:cytochrome c oxidase accessory protein FixG